MKESCTNVDKHNFNSVILICKSINSCFRNVCKDLLPKNNQSIQIIFSYFLAFMADFIAFLMIQPIFLFVWIFVKIHPEIKCFL